MKYYSEEFEKVPFPRKTVFDYLQEKNIGNEDRVAITYFGKEIVYKEFYTHVLEAAAVLSQMGVKKGDRVMYLLPNLPETAYYFYGGSILGAVADYVDPRPDSIDLNVSARKVLSLIIAEKVSYIVSLDQCYVGMIKPIEQELMQQGIEKILIVSATDSMGSRETINYLRETRYYTGLKNTVNKLVYSQKIGKKLKEAISCSPLTVYRNSEMIGQCDVRGITRAEYEEDLLCAIVHTSGTSNARPKPIPLTHDNLNAYKHASFWANMPAKVGDRTLHMLPYFAAYGLVNVTHSGLCHGNNLIQIPEFSPACLGKMILKHRPQTIIGTPTWFLSLLYDKTLQGADLSCLTMVTYGGDLMEIADEERVNHFLREHGCKVPLTKGHGMSETSGCASFANHDYNALGCMGIPIPGAIYALIDSETKEMIRFGDDEVIEGELIISSPAATSGVLDGQVIVPHLNYDGIEYIETRDIARMDKNGVMTFLARKDRSFTRYDGFKVKVYEIENIIKQNERVKYCVITPYKDAEKMGQMPIAHIVLEGEEYLRKEAKVAFIKQLVSEQFVQNENVSSRQIPSRFRIHEQLPVTKNGKIDYKKLEGEELMPGDICVNISETNISLGDIDVFIKNT